MAASVTLAPDGGIPCSCSVQTYAALHFMWGLNIKSDDQGAPSSCCDAYQLLISARLHGIPCRPWFPKLVFQCSYHPANRCQDYQEAAPAVCLGLQASR